MLKGHSQYSALPKTGQTPPPLTMVSSPTTPLLIPIYTTGLLLIPSLPPLFSSSPHQYILTNQTGLLRGCGTVTAAHSPAIALDLSSMETENYTSGIEKEKQRGGRGRGGRERKEINLNIGGRET